MVYKPRYADKRASSTHRALIDAVRDMIPAMEYEDISVSGIAERAGVNRKTFYQYYDCREDIFKEVCDEVVRDYTAEMQELRARSGSYEPIEFYQKFFGFFAQQEPYVEQMLCNTSYGRCALAIAEGCAASNRERKNIYAIMTEEERALFRDHLVNYLFFIYRRWVALGKTIPVDRVVDFAFKMGDRGMSWLRGEPKADV